MRLSRSLCFWCAATFCEALDAIDGIPGEVETIHVIAHCHIERRCGRAFFLVTAHVKVGVILAAVCQAMDQPRIAVKSEDDRLIGRENGIEIPIAQSVRMFSGRLQGHEVHHINHSNPEIRNVLAEPVYRGQSFECGNIAAAGHHHIRLAAMIVAGPVPDADSGGAMVDRRFHFKPLQGRLLARNDHVDVIPAAQAMIGHREQRSSHPAADRPARPPLSCSPRDR